MTPHVTNEPLGTWIARLPGRVVFIAVAMVQIAVEVAVTAAHDAWARLNEDDAG